MRRIKELPSKKRTGIRTEWSGVKKGVKKGPGARVNWSEPPSGGVEIASQLRIAWVRWAVGEWVRAMIWTRDLKYSTDRYSELWLSEMMCVIAGIPKPGIYPIVWLNLLSLVLPHLFFLWVFLLCLSISLSSLYLISHLSFHKVIIVRASHSIVIPVKSSASGHDTQYWLFLRSTLRERFIVLSRISRDNKETLIHSSRIPNFMYLLIRLVRISGYCYPRIEAISATSLFRSELYFHSCSLTIKLIRAHLPQP